MASLLYRLGRWCYRRRIVVITGWLVALLAIGGAAVALKAPSDAGFSVPGTESQRALDLLEAKFPGTGGASARVVVAAPAGQTLDEERYRTLLEPTLALLRKVPQTVPGTGATKTTQLTVSKDRRTAFGDVRFTVPVDEISDRTKAALVRIADPARAAGLEIDFSGGVIATGGEGSSSEALGIVVAFAVLIVTFAALSSALLPLLTAAVSVGIGLLALTAINGIVTLSSTASTLATMLGLAVGIDYALFIVSRHRQQVQRGMGLEESVGRAVATAGSAVVFAGLTVVIALVGLLLTGIAFLSAMGLGAALTVVVAVLVALTLLPALLGLLGTRALKGRRASATRMPMGERWSRLVTRRPVLSSLAVVVVLAVCAIPALHLDLGLPDAGSKPTTDTERRAYDRLTDGFGPGFNGPLTVVVDASRSPDPKPVGAAVATALGSLEDVAAVTAASSNPTGRVSIISVTPTSGPSSRATKDLVAEIRSRAGDAAARSKADVLVTGQTAINIDTSAKLGAALPGFIAFILGLALLLLLLVFRSLLVPVKAVAGFLLTIAASMGAVVWVFQDGHLAALLGVANEGPVLSFLPVLIIAILFGLAMDYQVFLVTRIREAYVHGDDALPAVHSGLRASARVVMAAALIMASVFGGFILGDDPIVKSIGFALAFGVLVDAFLIRLTLVPAVLALLGRRAWSLPGWIDRKLPNVDSEGEQLDRQLAAPEPEPAPVPVA